MEIKLDTVHKTLRIVPDKCCLRNLAFDVSQINIPLLQLNFEAMNNKTKNSLIRAKITFITYKSKTGRFNLHL